MVSNTNMYREEVHHLLVKDIKKLTNNIKVQRILKDILITLLDGQKLDKKYGEHKLVGDKKGYLECHLLPDLVLVYQKTKTQLRLNRICNHSELLK
jgi:mRNA interferase YafQ